jgi:hypothetical protein
MSAKCVNLVISTRARTRLRHLDDPKGRRDLPGYAMLDGEKILGTDGNPERPRKAEITHGPGDFSSRTT